MLNPQELQELVVSLRREANEINTGLKPLLTSTTSALTLANAIEQASAFSVEISQQKAELERLRANISEGLSRREELLIQCKRLIGDIEAGRVYLAEHEHDKANRLIEKMKINLGAPGKNLKL